ncbi:hypothetical protein BASA81_007102 [Batrachochytrium salamandrivorans]|nr:hypothetical protein BASA81_007102 [Batrachochytrium salamandrivorans]
MSSVSRYAAWRDALRRRRQQRVAQIGELSTTQVLRSLPNLPSSHQTTLVRFAASHRPVRLFWVDPKGERHHGYAIAAYSCHTEHTYPGHAFAVYLEEEEEGETLVASYRVLAGLSDSQSHLVDLTKLTARIHETITEARVICQLGHPALLPSYGEWEVSYSFSVPPLPPFTNFTNHTVYVWGDLSFDEYDFAKQRKVTNCKMNQLVPQVMIGRCLFDSNQHLVPQWKTFSTWVAQAQYYYQNHLGEEHGSRA